MIFVGFAKRESRLNNGTDVTKSWIIKKVLAIVVLSTCLAACSYNAQGNGSSDSSDSLTHSESTSLEGDEAKIAALLKLEPVSYYEPISEWEETYTPREEAALALANRVVTMYTSIDYSQSDSVWLWGLATEKALMQYTRENRMQQDSAVCDLHDALHYYGYDAHTQYTMNENAQYLTVIQTYDAVARYRLLLSKIEDEQLKRLIRAEYNAWFEWLDAKYFTNVYHTHGADRYSALPLDFHAFHEYYTENRLAMIDIEEDILMNDGSYQQRGKTVTTKQWKDWLNEQGYHEGMSPEFNMEDPVDTDFPALIKDKTERWIAARRAVSFYLGEKTGKGLSYDRLTADIHASIIGMIKPILNIE